MERTTLTFRKTALKFLVVVLFLALILSGCGGGNNTTSNQPTDSKSNKGSEDNQPSEEASLVDFTGLEFSEYINYDWASDMEWGQSPITEWIKDNKKVQINWISSGGAAKQKLSTMIATNELPDVMVMDRGPELEQLVQAGLLAPIDEYVTKYPQLRKWASDKVLDALRSSDGKLYGIPNWYTNENMPLGNQGWVVNEKIYNEMGSPQLETFEDLEEYLLDVKQKYPDIVPLGTGGTFGSGMVFYATFAENRTKDLAGMFVYQDGDELKSLFEDPAMKEFLIYANRMYRNGLLDPDTFTQSGDQFKEKMISGNVAVAVMHDSLGTMQKWHREAKNINSEVGFLPIPYIYKKGLNPENLTPSSYAAVGWNVSVITKKAKDPEKIFAYFDWLTGEEGSAITFWGPPGLYWDEKVEYSGTMVPKPNDAFLNTSDTERVDKGDYNWSANSPWIMTSEEYWNTFLPQDPTEYDHDTAVKYARGSVKNMDEYQGILPDPTIEEGIIFQNIKDEFSVNIAKAVLAKSEEDVLKVIDEANANAEKLEYHKALEYMNKKWKENLKLITQ